ncbi:TraB/GumN family protein [Rhizobacter sp. SG703]|uniref:TraB/GumN family protein n=1 Tax=Rhizobacter sp. SG703 TaxID=2587140 RepID=UPI00144641AC|nr:TraB/GumN family protein [Rhizobacter sp. SG703]NKI96366.1 hypothetical protein [Rhizobacter sp. SG703]
MPSTLALARRLMAALPLLWFATTAPAQDADAACARQAAAQAARALKAQSEPGGARDRGFLWRISKGGHDSWLYGTMHVARPDWVIPGPAVAAALRESERIALELDVTDADIARRLGAAQGPGGGEPLPQALEQRLQGQARAACIPDAISQSLSPVLLALNLAVTAGRADGLDPAYGIDAFIALLGHQLGKQVVSLETPEMQLEMLTGGTPEERVEMIDRTLADLEKGQTRRMLKRIADVWSGSRLDELERYASWCDCMKTADDRRDMKRMLDERNPAMAEQVAAWHDGGERVFAAVGSLHMIGPQGLPALLKARGYRVERIVFKR